MVFNICHLQTGMRFEGSKGSRRCDAGSRKTRDCTSKSSHHESGKSSISKTQHRKEENRPNGVWVT